jgi:serine protease Do
MRDVPIASLSRKLRLVAVAPAVALVVALGSPNPGQAQGVRGLPDFTELVDQVGPAVVNIRTLERGRPSVQMDENVEEFFRRFGIPLPGRPDSGRGPGSEEPVQRGVGSGFILSGDGYVMTNAHVVEGADEVLVTLTDKREFKAKIIGADKRTDVAVVKIDAGGLPAVRIGDVSRLRVGEWVVAIGSPFGLDNTVTAGIVSAKGRETGDYLPFIQTDVAINPGNSGGPLLNMRGEVVGVNSQIYSRSGGFMGISFAIPIDDAMGVADQLRTNGRVIRGRIGVQIAPVTKEVVESLGLGKQTGALVQGVESGGPAEKAGMEPGDVILKADGKPIEKSSDLPRIIGGIKPGTKSMLQVFRRGSYRDLTVTVSEFEPDRPTRVAGGNGAAKPDASMAALGLTLSDLTDAQKRELKLRSGVMVDAAEGAAGRAGLKRGDVIVSLDETEVTSAKHFASLVARAERGKPLTVLVRQGDWINRVVIRPGR